MIFTVLTKFDGNQVVFEIKPNLEQGHQHNCNIYIGQKFYDIAKTEEGREILKNEIFSAIFQILSQ